MAKNSLELMNYKITNKAEDECELTFYGEVVEQIPTNWWTGEKSPGMFISQEEFMQDIEGLKNKSKITVRLNSCGGDYDTGLLIHNRLKGLTAHKVGILDGLAASAASIIMCACDEVQVFPGSRFMIHEAKAGLCGWFGEEDLQKRINAILSCKTSMTQIYKQKTGMPEEEIQNLTKQETWYVGQEIIDAGFANTLIADEKQDVKMKIENNGKILIANGVKHDISSFKNFPTSNLSMDEASLIEKITNKVKSALKANTDDVEASSNKDLVEASANAQKDKEREKVMCKTVEELKNAYPDLVAQLEKTASEQAKIQAASAERQRIQEIEEIEASINDSELIAKSKFGSDEEVINAKDLAFIAMKKQKEQGADYLAKIGADSKESNTDKITPVANAGLSTPKTDEANAADLMSEAMKAVTNKLEGGLK